MKTSFEVRKTRKEIDSCTICMTRLVNVLLFLFSVKLLNALMNFVIGVFQNGEG